MLGHRLFAPLVTAVIVCSACGQPSRGGTDSEYLDVSYLDIAEPGFIDQTVLLRPKAGLALEVTIDYQALDDDGEPIPEVEVATAYGSDRGLLVVLPGGIYDVLAFSGDRADRVADVRATVKTAVPAKIFTQQSVLPEPVPLHDGAEVERFDVFDQVKLTNEGATDVTMRVVCLVYDSPPEGQAQQAIEMAEVIDRILVPAGTTKVRDVSPEFDRRTQSLGAGCDSLKAHPTP